MDEGLEIVRRARDDLSLAIARQPHSDLKTAAHRLVEALDTYLMPQRAAVLVDPDDDRWAFAEMPDRTWKLYERTSDDRVWLEVEHAGSYEDAVNARDQRARQRVAAEIFRFMDSNHMDQAGELMERHNFTVEELNRLGG
jgi:hypothetical protein